MGKERYTYRGTVSSVENIKYNHEDHGIIFHFNPDDDDLKGLEAPIWYYTGEGKKGKIKAERIEEILKEGQRVEINLDAEITTKKVDYNLVGLIRKLE